MPLRRVLRTLPRTSLLAAAMVSVACRKPVDSGPDLTIAHRIQPWPPRVGIATVRLAVANKAGQPVQGARIALEGDMTHPGMAPQFGSAAEISPGQYEGRLNLTMSGDWVILLHLTLPQGRRVERQIPLTGVAQ